MAPTLSTRAVSLSDHVKRRKNSAVSKRGGDTRCGATGSNDSAPPTCSSSQHSGSGITSNSNIIGSASIATNSPLKIYSPQHPPQPGPILMGRSSSSRRREEGGYDSHVASYGNCDAPSAHCRSYHASEHGCYAAESHIFGGGGGGIGGMGWRNHTTAAATNHSNSNNNNNNKAMVNTIHNMARLESYSNPLLDLEEQRYICSSSRQRRTPKSTSTTVQQQPPPLPPSTSGMCVPQDGRSGGGRTARETWDGGIRQESMTYSHDPRCQGDSSSFCSNAPTASTAGSSSGSSSSSYSHHSIDTTSSIPPLDEDAIRQGIIDFSTLVATYLAGALSFIIGIFLTLLSPLVKIIKCIVGDVLGLLDDAGFLNELGSLWRLYRDLRHSSERSHYSSASNGDYHPYSNHHHHPRYQDDTSLEDGSTTVCSAETSTQYVGGWRPHVCPSVGSGCSSSVNTPNSMGRTRPSSSSSSSWGGGVTVNASTSPRPHSLLPSGQDSRPGLGVFSSSKNNDEVSSCPPNIMMRHQQAAQSSESSLYYTSRNNDAYVSRSTDLLRHQPLLPPGTPYNASLLYPQIPTHRYPRSKSDVTS